MNISWPIYAQVFINVWVLRQKRKRYAGLIANPDWKYIPARRRCGWFSQLRLDLPLKKFFCHLLGYFLDGSPQMFSILLGCWANYPENTAKVLIFHGMYISHLYNIQSWSYISLKLTTWITVLMVECRKILTKWQIQNVYVVTIFLCNLSKISSKFHQYCSYIQHEQRNSLNELVLWLLG